MQKALFEFKMIAMMEVNLKASWEFDLTMNQNVLQIMNDNNSIIYGKNDFKWRD